MHFLSITDLSAKQIQTVLDLGRKLKHELKDKEANRSLLAKKTLVMIFEKPSLRTRTSFEIGTTQLGGHAIYLAPSDIGLGVREEISDVAKVTASMANIIMARVFKHETVKKLAKYSSVPVINALSDLEHPCQILADVLTILEVKKNLAGLKIAFIGDGENNVTHSLALACGTLGIHFTVASPKGYEMNKDIAQKAKKLAGQTNVSIIETNDPKKAVKDADVVYTDTWVSMGDEKEKEKRIKVFSPYRSEENTSELQ